jgi:serine/threonine protein kinase
VSAEGKDFVSKILVANPKYRMTCDQMLEHPWLNMKLSDEKLSKTRSNLTKY